MNTNETAAATKTVDTLRAERQALEDQLAALRDELRAAKASTVKAKRQPRACACGCGDVTGGGVFLPGHDAKLKSRLLAVIDEGGEEGEAALAELRRYPRLAVHAWDGRLGRKARERAEKAGRKAERGAATTRNKATDEAAREAARALRDRSKEEAYAAQEERLANKERALAAAKTGQM